MIAKLYYKCNGPRARLSIHSGTSPGQVAWQPVQVPMNSQCTLKSGYGHQPGAAIVLESWGYLEAPNGGDIARGENAWRSYSGKREW